MARNWNERDHPRDDDGRFRDRVGSDGWAQRISDSIGKGRGDSSGGYDADAQQRWEGEVRDAIREAGFDPDELEAEWAESGGFGQDYLEYPDDPAMFAETVIEAYMHPEGYFDTNRDDPNAQQVSIDVLAGMEDEEDGFSQFEFWDE